MEVELFQKFGNKAIGMGKVAAQWAERSLLYQRPVFRIQT